MNEQRARLAAKEISAALDDAGQIFLVANALVDEVITAEYLGMGGSRKVNLRDHFLPQARRALAGNPHVTDGTAVVALDSDEDGGWVPHISFRSRLRQPLTYIEQTITVG